MIITDLSLKEKFTDYAVKDNFIPFLRQNNFPITQENINLCAMVYLKYHTQSFISPSMHSIKFAGNVMWKYLEEFNNALYKQKLKNLL